jgi:rhamnosyltransferase subunit B
MKNVAIFALGTSGDVYPLITVAKEISRKYKNSTITFLSNGHYKSLIEDSNFNFLEVSPKSLYNHCLSDPKLCTVFGVMRYTRTLHISAIEKTYYAIKSLHEENRLDFVMGTGTFNGAQWAANDLSIQYFRAVFSPHADILLKKIELDCNAENKKNYVKKIGQSLRIFLSSQFYFWLLINSSVNSVRKSLGHAKWHPGSLIKEMQHTLTVALYPNWMTKISNNSYHKTHFFHFPLLDPVDPKGRLAADCILARCKGKPIVFTLGTGITNVLKHIDYANSVCRELQVDGVFVAETSNGVDKKEFKYLQFLEYVDFKYLFARSSLVVHHGGIGTAAQALAAGIPQLIRPVIFDQHDNAFRLMELGVAAALFVNQCSVDQSVRLIQYLQTSTAVTEAIRKYRFLTAETSGASLAADFITTYPQSEIYANS